MRAAALASGNVHAFLTAAGLSAAGGVERKCCCLENICPSDENYNTL